MVVLSIVPAETPFTVTLNVQLVFAASDPPVKLIVLGVVVVKEPPHVTVGPLLAMVKPPTRVSLKSMPLRALFRFGLVIVKVSVDVLPVKIEGERRIWQAQEGQSPSGMRWHNW